MPPHSFSNNDQWLEDIMRRMFTQTQNASGNASKGATEDEARASQAARDARRLAKVAMQMAIGVLDAADEQQDEADTLFRRRLTTEKEQRRAENEKQRRCLVAEERKREIERARQEEVDQMRRAMERLQQEEKEQERIREDTKKEKKRQKEDAKRRVAEQEAAEALKEAQAEAKKFREAAERARQEADCARQRAERAEEAQRQRAAKDGSEQPVKNQQKESAAWARYIDQWELFKRFALVTGPTTTGGVFRFEDIPWPMLSPPTSPSMIIKKTVEAFLFSSSSNQAKSLKTRIRECLLIWHPDKFSGSFDQTRWMRFVLEKDRARVAEGVSAVTQAGNDILAEYATRRNTM